MPSSLALLCREHTTNRTSGHINFCCIKHFTWVSSFIFFCQSLIRFPSYFDLDNYKSFQTNLSIYKFITINHFVQYFYMDLYINSSLINNCVIIAWGYKNCLHCLLFLYFLLLTYSKYSKLLLNEWTITVFPKCGMCGWKVI